jgi:outer membrane protein OmpA-like peptidoglycan-associated protein
VIKRFIIPFLILCILPIAAPISNAVEGTPVGAPLMVKTVDVAPVGDGTSDINVTWSLETSGANSGSTILGFSATVFTGTGYTTATSATCSVPTEAATTCKITGLSYGATYEVGVTASNAVGTSTIRMSAPFTTSTQSQTVAFKDGTKSSATYGDPDFQVEATASSNLAITWSSTTTGVCSVDAGGIVHLLTSGTCTIKATQTGVGSAYSAAFATTNISVTSSASATIRSASSVLGSSAVLNGTVPFPGTNVSPVFCYSTTNDSSTCSNTLTPSPATITSSSGTSISASATSLSAGTTYYFWISISGGATKSSIASFTTLSGATLTQSGSSTCEVGKDCSVLISATGGSGTYPTWSATAVPDGLTFTSGITESTISGTPTANSTLAVTVTVTDSDLSVSRTTVNFVITTPNTGGSGGSGGGTPIPTPVVTPAGPSSQVIAVTNLPDPAYVGDSDLQLNGLASSALPVTYLSTSSKTCTISTTGLLKILSVGKCLLTLSQAGNSSYNPATKSVSVEITNKLLVTLEEFTNVQSSGATVVATAPWPGDDASVKFCISLNESKGDCTLPSGVSISDPLPITVTKDSGSVVTANITGLAPGTNYFVWAIEKVGDQQVTSEIRKLHTPIGPMISYSGKTSYAKANSVRIQFRATGGARGYKNWKVTGFPVGAKLAPSTSSFTVTGKNLKSGTFIISVSVADKLGSISSISFPLIISGGLVVGQPGQVQSAVAQLISSTAIKVAWKNQDDAQKYEVTLAGKLVCATSENNCEIQQLLGPKAQIAVTAISAEGVKSQPISTLYKAPAMAIDIAIANFALNSSVLSSSDKSKITALAKVIQTQGFTSVQVAGYIDSEEAAGLNSALSKARATSTFNYLKQILAKTPISVTLINQGANSPAESNSTPAGRAANRRAVISLK